MPDWLFTVTGYRLNLALETVYQLFTNMSNPGPYYRSPGLGLRAFAVSPSIGTQLALSKDEANFLPPFEADGYQQRQYLLGFADAFCACCPPLSSVSSLYVLFSFMSVSHTAPQSPGRTYPVAHLNPELFHCNPFNLLRITRAANVGGRHENRTTPL